jgi:hypothetical protein
LLCFSDFRVLWLAVTSGVPITPSRPIAIGEARLRLAALFAVHESSELGPSLAPLQLGVCIPGGVGHALHSALDAHLDHLLLSLECKNAFKSLSRQAIFHAAQEHVPSLMKFLSWAFDRPLRVYLRGAPDNYVPVLSTSGVKQGDPLGPVRFALALQGTLPRTAAAHLQCRSSHTLTMSMSSARQRLQPPFLNPWPRKCEPWALPKSPSKAQCTARTQIWQQLPQPDSVYYMGTQAWWLPEPRSAKSSSFTSSMHACDKTFTTRFGAFQIFGIRSPARTSG